MDIFPKILVSFILINSLVYTQGWFRGWKRFIRFSGRRQSTICNERRTNISCRYGQTLKILSAVYGRTEVWTCRPRNKKQKMCRLNVLRQVQDLCQQKRSCKLYSSNRVFNKPCSGTEKYLRIKYQCVKGQKKNACALAPCKNGGICKSSGTNFSCNCRSGFTGKKCEINVNECKSNPCQNKGRCVDMPNRYKCVCKPGYTGRHCEVGINECKSNPCQNGGRCVDGINRYTCVCKRGFRGLHCKTEINACKSSPCQNHGICQTVGLSYKCKCKPNYTGDRCQTKRACSSNPCKNNGKCKDIINGFICTCRPGYTGAQCQTDINECSPSPCQNGATCVDRIDGYRCQCCPGYSGVNCHIDVDECASMPCSNNGKCQDDANSYQCVCLRGYSGPTCEKKDGPNSVECGTPYWKPTLIQTRIVGGNRAKNYSWPWIVQLRLNEKHECGGAIIAPNWIVTAKHCFLLVNDATKWTIYAGKTHKSLQEPSTQQKRKAVKIVDAKSPDHILHKDISLVKVDKPFNYNNYVRPICLPTKDVKVGDICFVKGWGETQGTGHENVLKNTKLPIKDTKKCNTTINPTLAGQITENMFCAGFQGGGHDACQGDSGGPFDCIHSNKWYLSGIVSWGIGCAEKNMPGVFVNVIKFVTWITSTIALD
ncbi:coagulation factor IX-like [Mytilus californianus]|uniref:coagulation factor IX-like n=1 Tax=Mytilus californianus TaxID=6549 RepID=UPI00224807DB|nr:coagulation factor IX-like [Mytilus californianus]